MNPDSALQRVPKDVVLPPLDLATPQQAVYPLVPKVDLTAFVSNQKQIVNAINSPSRRSKESRKWLRMAVSELFCTVGNEIREHVEQSLGAIHRFELRTPKADDLARSAQGSDDQVRRVEKKWLVRGQKSIMVGAKKQEEALNVAEYPDRVYLLHDRFLDTCDKYPRSRKVYPHCTYGERASFIRVKDLLTPHSRKELLTAIQSLSGRTDADVIKNLTEYGIPHVALPGPHRIRFEGGECFQRAEFEQIRLSFGCLDEHAALLIDRQAHIERQSISRFSVTVKGRIDARLIDWACGTSIEDPGPIPDIEIVYKMKLPSGKFFPFVLHAARDYSEYPPTSLENLSRDDRKIIRRLEEYFRDPENAKHYAIFSAFRLSDYPPELHAYLRQPVGNWPVEIYEAVASHWDASVLGQLLEWVPKSKSYRTVHWLIGETPSFEDFCRLLTDRLDHMPYEQTIRPPDFYRVPHYEYEKFIQRYARGIYDIIVEEKDRITAERESGAHEKRRAEGYEGPPEGMPLSLDIFLMDAISDFKAKALWLEQRRKSTKARSDHTPTNAPIDVGRDYNDRSGIFTIHELPHYLAQKTCQRVVRCHYVDPLTGAHVLDVTRESLRKLRMNLCDVNLQRFLPVVTQRIREIAAATHASEEPNSATNPGASLRARAAKFTELFTTHRNVIRSAEKELQSRIEDRNSVLKNAPVQTYRLHLQGKDALKFVQGLRAEHQKKIDDAFREVFKLKVVLHNFCADNFPESCAKVGIGDIRVVDEQLIKLIYSIGADRVPVFSEETLSDSGTVRRKTHSQCLKGKNMYAGGELILGHYQEVFVDLAEWERFDDRVREVENPQWKAFELNNATGHYQTYAITLPWASALVFPALDAAQISTASCRQVNRLAPGLRFDLLKHQSI